MQMETAASYYREWQVRHAFFLGNVRLKAGASN